MTTLRYDHVLRCFVIQCHRCLTWHQTIFQTRDGDLCERCLQGEEKEAA